MRKSSTEKLRNLQSVELRKQTQLERDFIREALQSQKMQELNHIKQLKQINESKRREVLLKQQEEKFSKHDTIKQQEEKARLKKKAFYDSRVNLIKKQMENKKRDEAKVKNLRELEVMNMEKLELELIKKLQQTQDLQKAAFDELEVALAEKPNDYEQRFMINKKLKKRDQLSRGGANVVSPKQIDINQLVNDSKKFNFEQDQSQQYFKGQPDRNVEEIERPVSQQLRVSSVVSNHKSDSNSELKNFVTEEKTEEKQQTIEDQPQQQQKEDVEEKKDA